MSAPDETSADPLVEIKAELGCLYAKLEQEIAEFSPRCDASGRCCRFAEYGHTLFLSAVEAAWLFEPGAEAMKESAGRPLDRDTCPYQVGKLCTARERRPIGCRVYFCDPTFAERQQELSEQYLLRLKGLHREKGWDWDYRPLHRFMEDLVGYELPEASLPIVDLA